MSNKADNVFYQSNKIYEKLRMINFQKKFIAKKNSGKVIPPEYFAIV